MHRIEMAARCRALQQTAVDFLADVAHADGSFAPARGACSNAMTTAEVLVAAHDGRVAIPGWLPDHAVNFLLRAQRADGSWTDPGDADPWDVSATAWAVRALNVMQRGDAIASRARGLRWLHEMVRPDGGLPTRAARTHPNTYASAYALRALAAEAGDAPLAIARFLLRTQNADGGWGLEVGDASESTLTAYVLHGLIDSGAAVGVHAASRAVAWLRGMQAPQGSWGSWLGEIESVEGTAFCSYVLRLHGEPWSDADARALAYLASRERRGDLFVLQGTERAWIAVSVLLAAHALQPGGQP